MAGAAPAVPWIASSPYGLLAMTERWHGARAVWPAPKGHVKTLAMAKTVISLDDRYDLDVQKLFLTGAQAITRLPMMQRRRDLAAGLNTAGYISGYRGSPLGTYDQQLTQAKRFLDAHHIVFQPGVNEDLAATAIWGTQQAHLSGEGQYDGVFGIWYGKGPGVDRSGDALRHGN